MFSSLELILRTLCNLQFCTPLLYSLDNKQAPFVLQDKYCDLFQIYIITFPFLMAFKACQLVTLGLAYTPLLNVLSLSYLNPQVTTSLLICQTQNSIRVEEHSEVVHVYKNSLQFAM